MKMHLISSAAFKIIQIKLMMLELGHNNLCDYHIIGINACIPDCVSHFFWCISLELRMGRSPLDLFLSSLPWSSSLFCFLTIWIEPCLICLLILFCFSFCFGLQLMAWCKWDDPISGLPFTYFPFWFKSGLGLFTCCCPSLPLLGWPIGRYMGKFIGW